MVTVAKLIWDNFNVQHIARHHVTVKQVEAVCRSKFVARQTYGNRLLITGLDDAGRLLSVVLGPAGDDVYYVVTARAASTKERRAFRQSQE